MIFCYSTVRVKYIHKDNCFLFFHLFFVSVVYAYCMFVGIHVHDVYIHVCTCMWRLLWIILGRFSTVLVEVGSLSQTQSLAPTNTFEHTCIHVRIKFSLKFYKWNNKEVRESDKHHCCEKFSDNIAYIKREDRRKEILEVKTFSQEGQQNTDVLGYMRIKAYLYILKSDSWKPEMKMKSLSQKLK